MQGVLQAWDGVELWLVTLPFPVQVAVMLAIGAPVFVAVAAVVDRVADLVVGLSRATVRGRDHTAAEERSRVCDARE